MPACELGLGCVTFGREIDRAASFAMLDQAAELGWTHLDTAAAYGAGASEQIVGEWLAAHGGRERFTLCTKILPPYSAVGVEAAVEQSRRRLGVEAIDLLYLHKWDATATEPRTLAALAALMRNGKVRAIGLSNFNVAQMEDMVARAMAAGLNAIRALQNVNNLALRSIDEPTRRVCAAHGISIVTYSPLGAGFLTGKYDSGVAAGTRFAVIPGHQNLYFTPAARARLARLQAVAAQEGLAVADLALAWALHQPQIGTVLIGGRTPAQLKQAVRARAIDLPAIFAKLETD
jgi:aryl-alcohol dehydrogenase-like predicted oxidoreductase